MTDINSDITLITPPESQPALEAALATNPALTSLPSPKPEILAPKDLEQTTGTGAILRLPEVQKRITSDFVILPCDLVSELDGSKILQQWMTLNPLSSSKKRKGGLGVYYPTHGLEGISNKNDETDFICTTPLSRPAVPPPHGSLRSEVEIVALSIPTDSLKDKIEDNNGIFKMRVQLTQKYGRVKLKMKHRDAHVYVFPQWVKDFAARNETFDSISEDVLGWWAKAQWQNGLGEKLGLDEVLSQHEVSIDDMENSQIEEDIADAAQLSSTKISLPVRPATNTTFASRVGSRAPTAKGLEPLEVPPLYAYVQPNPPAAGLSTSDHPLIRRIDTSAALLSVSLYLAKQTFPTHPLAPEHKIHPSATVGLQSRVAQEDSLIAENVTIGTRTVVKECVVGANCEIGNYVKLTRCLLMDGVKVGDGVQLTGCIVGRRARIEGMKPADSNEGANEDDGKAKKKKPAKDDDDEDRTKLTECEVAPNFVVQAGTEAKGEKMMAELAGMEGESEEDETDDDLA
jgi:translation initiation factor eIF-2B subunit gamma